MERQQGVDTGGAAEMLRRGVDGEVLEWRRGRMGCGEGFAWGPASQKLEHIRRGAGQVHLDIKVVLGPECLVTRVLLCAYR